MTRQNFDKDLYAILGVASTATPEELKQAYRRRAMEKHPDLKQDPEEKQAATVRFREVSEAYEILRDPQMREEYDRDKKVKDYISSDYWQNISYSTYEDDYQFDTFMREWDENLSIFEQGVEGRIANYSKFLDNSLKKLYNEDGTVNKEVIKAFEAEREKIIKEYKSAKNNLIENSINALEHVKKERNPEPHKPSYPPTSSDMTDNNTESSTTSSETPKKKPRWQLPLSNNQVSFKNFITLSVATAIAVASVGSYFAGYNISSFSQKETLKHCLENQRNIDKTQTMLSNMEVDSKKAPALEMLQAFGGVALKEKGIKSLHEGSPKKVIKEVNRTFGTDFVESKKVEEFISNETDKKYKELDKKRGTDPGTTWEEFNNLANRHPGKNVYSFGQNYYKQRLEELQQEQKAFGCESSRLETKTQRHDFLFNVSKNVAAIFNSGYQYLQEQSMSLLAQMQQQRRH